MQTNRLLFGATIGIIGGGQLGRMMATTARHMGYRIVVLDPTPNCPAGQLADDQIIAAYDDLSAVKKLAEKSDVVTYEFENVDLQAATYLEEAGILPQGANSLAITQDREKEKQAMVDSGQSVAPFAIIQSKDELNKAVKTIGFPAVVKTCRGGYDGKGQVKLSSADDLAEAEQLLAKSERLIYEAWISFDKEISIVFTRGMDGSIKYFPIGENIHRDHILHTTIVPAKVSDTVMTKAHQAVQAIAETINVVGTFAIELFVQDDNIYINELAPRPHNSGHYTIEACNVSQFEQHVRAICGLPLLPVYFHGASVMVNLLGQDVVSFFEKIHQDENTGHIHMYGKDKMAPKRKMGHVTYVANNREELVQNLLQKQMIEID